MSDYIDRYLQWQKRSFSTWGRRIQIIIFPVLFILIFVFSPGWIVNRFIKIPIGLPLYAGIGLGALFFTLGFGLYLWTIVLFARVKGTQVPIAPTQAVVTTGPYAVSRNPMVTGGMIMVLGAGLLMDSWAFVLAGLIPPIPYLLYVKLVEERELEARFGDAYVAYRKSTPFLVPRFRKDGKQRRSIKGRDREQ